MNGRSLPSAATGPGDRSENNAGRRMQNGMSVRRSRTDEEQPLFESWSRTDLNRFRKSLADWFRERARDLPWRRTGDPYRIWISEVMLQQTTVVAVVPYFEKFIARFPTVQDLAAANQDDVLRHWEGLGYYSRARNLHRAAQELVRQRGGRFPETVEELTSLPGIGRYTAGAILSFAFDRPAPILEANTLRLYSRLLNFDGNPRATHGQKLLWSFAAHLLPESGSGNLNQALMELGSLVCTPQNPDCEHCPVLKHCRAREAGRQNDIPAPMVRPEITELVEVALAIEHAGRYLLRRNPEGQRWAGLWDFIRLPHDDTLAEEAAFLKPHRNVSRKLAGRLEQLVAEQTGQRIQVQTMLSSIRHSVTRYRIQLQCLSASAEEPVIDEAADIQWVPVSRLHEFPLSVTGRRLARLVETISAEESTRPGRLF